MADIDTPTSDALIAAPQQGIVSRDAVTFFVRDRTSGDIVTFGFWLGEDTITTDVIDGDDGTSQSREFVGQGGAVDGTPLASVSDVPNTNDLSVREVTVTMSQIHATVLDMFRGYDCRLAPAQVHRILFDPATMNVVGVPVCHFLGQINLGPLSTPAPSADGNISFTIVSNTQELTRTNAAKLSDQTQQRRSPGDAALQYVSVLGAGVTLPWGEASISTAAPLGSSSSASSGWRQS